MPWWMFGPRNRPDHVAQLDAEGGWPEALVALNSRRAVAEQVKNLPPGWYDANVPVSGNIMPISKAYLASPQEKLQLHLKPIGPVDASTSRANALQAALAASLAGIQKQ